MTKSSINDVAKAAGVSIATVSRAFSHPEKVLPATRKKVLQAAEQLDFIVSRTAGVLKSGKAYRIALLVGSNKIEWFTACVIEGLDEVFRNAGYDLVIQPINGLKQRKQFFEELPVRGNTDAVIVSSFAISTREAEQLNRINVPIIGINCAGAQSLSASIAINDATGARLAIEHLATLGHQHIYYIYEQFLSPFHFSSAQRISSFKDACKDLNTPHAGRPAAFPKLQGTVFAINPGESTFDTILSKILLAQPRPTALIFHQDSIAIPFMFRLQKMGIRVPEDLSIIGFDDSTFAQEIGLTTIRQNPRNMAKQAAQTTLALINGQPIKQTHINAPIQLRIRNSTSLARK